MRWLAWTLAGTMLTLGLACAGSTSKDVGPDIGIDVPTGDLPTTDGDADAGGERDDLGPADVGPDVPTDAVAADTVADAPTTFPGWDLGGWWKPASTVLT